MSGPFKEVKPAACEGPKVGETCRGGGGWKKVRLDLTDVELSRVRVSNKPDEAAEEVAVLSGRYWRQASWKQG